MRKLIRRFLALHPMVQDAVVTSILILVYAVVVVATGFSDGWPWWACIAVGGVAGWLMGRVGRYVGEVAQARRDLADDKIAMRDAINRLERGGR